MRPCILILLAAIVLIGCGKEKEDPKPGNSLVGTWTGVSQESKVTSNGQSLAQELMDALPVADLAWANENERIAIGTNDLRHTLYFSDHDQSWRRLDA